MHAKHSQMSASRPRRRRISPSIIFSDTSRNINIGQGDSREAVVGGGTP